MATKQGSGQVWVIGAGMAGCEAAWQLLRQGIPVTLVEMRPSRMTPAHQSGDFAEMVCSNSFKSTAPGTASALLKEEMARLDSLILEAAFGSRVPAGSALAVERRVFSERIRARLEAHPQCRIVQEEWCELPCETELRRREEWIIVATGPLTSAPLVAALAEHLPEAGALAFYDAIAPVIAADSLDWDHCFRGNRYDPEAEGDYVNVPLDRETYELLVDAISGGECTPLRNFEEPRYFESCLPVEVLVERGRETLRFGPLRPVGVVDPRTGRRPWANLQLRRENTHGTMLSLVGFQTKLKWPEQKRILSLLPALREVEILRFGSVHRNTYVRSPQALAEDFSLRRNRRVFLAGQITGVEGYLESAACGLWVALGVAAQVRRQPFELPPDTTMMGALAGYVLAGNGSRDFAPMNSNLGLLPPVPKERGSCKRERKLAQCAAAADRFSAYLARFPSLMS